MSVLSTFRIIAPEFDSSTGAYPVTDDDVEDWIDLATERVSAEVLGARTTEGIARIVAHELTMQARAASVAGGGVGPVKSKSAGQVSITYSDGAMSTSHGAEDDFYRQTTHGLAYLQIRDSRAETGMGLLL